MTSPDLGRVAVLMGGWSAEREVSLSSGQQVLDALLSKGVDAFAVDVERDQLCDALLGKCDRVFNILHGTWGEDGRVQGLLDVLDIPYTGTGVHGCALTMDKNLTKAVCEQHAIVTPAWKIVSDLESCSAAAKKIGSECGYPVVIKPVREGSSVGVSIARENQIEESYLKAAEYGDVMVEQFIGGSEITAAIINGSAMPLIKISTPREFYDYEAKYHQDSTVYDCPCGLSAEVEKEIQNTALKVFEITHCKAWGRVDFLLDEAGKHYLLEVNTAPGMTDHSLVPMAAAATGLSFPELVYTILSTTVESQ